MSAIIEHEDSGSSRVLKIGDASTPISAKTYQDIYHQITGRTEQIRKRYSDNILIEFPDLEQLHHKITQLCSIHTVIAKNESVSVFHDKERKEQFTSFERFQLYNSTAASPTVSVVLKYNFSIISAETGRPQEYVIVIRLSSRVAMLQQAEEDAPPFMRGRVISFLSENTSEVTVEYADYIVARGFLEAFDEWIRGCKCTPRMKWLRSIQSWSHFLPKLFRITIVFAATLFALRDIPEFFHVQNNSETLAKFIIIYAGVAYILISLSSSLGHLLEEAIDTYPTLSYLKINKGDARIIEEFEGRKKRSIFKLLMSVTGTIALGIIASKLEQFL